ncbi:unnamed protein product, partial [marine sediment metagenome]
MAKGKAMPQIQEEILYRTNQQLLLLEDEHIADEVARYSAPEPCAPFRKFGLYVYAIAVGIPYNIHVEVEFLNRWTAQWHTYKQWPFAALFFEGVQCANGIWECFYGEVAGRVMRVKVTG